MERSEEPETPASDDADEALDVSVPSLSGTYIELEKQGKLDALLALQKERERLQFELMATNAELSQFNNPIWLTNFYIMNRPKGRRFGAALTNRADSLEKQKRHLGERIIEVEREMASISPLILQMSPPAPVLDTSFHHTALKSTPFLDVSEHTDTFALVRDLMIKKYAQKGLSDAEICGQLDLELMVPDRPPLGIPQRWLDDYRDDWGKKYQWRLYQAAYKDPRTKNLMQKMISKAKVRYT